MTLMDTVYASLIGIFIAVLGGYLKQRYSTNPEDFKIDKLLRTMFVAVIWTFIKVLAEQYGLPIAPDPIIQGLLDSGTIAIIERWFMVAWRKLMGT